MAVPKISKVIPAPTPICLYLEDVMKLALEIAELGGFTNLYEALVRPAYISTNHF